MTANQTCLDLTAIPPYQQRSFVPENADLTSPEQVENLYQQINDRELSSEQEFQQWILDRSELDAAFDQNYSVIYIRMTCQTDNTEYAQAFKDITEKVKPLVKHLTDQLDRKFLATWQQYPLDEDRYLVYRRNTKADVKLFREENVSLQTEEDLLLQQYQKTTGAMTVHFQDEEYTMQQMVKFLQEPDRSLRESAWQATSDRRLQDKDTLDEIYDKMIDLRNRIAAQADTANFQDYSFHRYHRFDYTVDDCRKFHQAVETQVVPFLAEMYEHRRKELKVDVLKPWDLTVDPQNLPPLKPFDTIDEFIAGVSKMFHQLDTQLGQQFDDMARLNLLNLDSRKGKAPGGYQSTLNELRKPFIFMNAVGTNRDIFTLLHEGGHAFHAVASAPDPLVDYRHAPIEFCEVASMSMELLAAPYLPVFYTKDEISRCLRNQFDDIVWILAWVATIDAFQHWIYENPDHTRQQRCDQWVEIYNRFGGNLVDYSGLDVQKRYNWQKQLHLFQCPFYYIEYAIAQLGALGVWQQSLEDPAAALRNYKSALALGGSRPLSELFAAAGVKFDFSEKTIAPLMKTLKTHWQKYL